MGINLESMTTETRNPDTMDLDRMTALEVVTAMNREDAKVPAAIAPQLPNIAQVAETPLYFVFLFDHSPAQLYDKTSLEGGTAEAFRGFIRERTGLEVQYIK